MYKGNMVDNALYIEFEKAKDDKAFRDFLNNLLDEIKKSKFLDCEVQNIKIESLHYLRYSIIAKLILEGSKVNKQVAAKIEKRASSDRNNNFLIKQEWETLNFLHARPHSGTESIVKPLFYLQKDGLQAMVTEWIEGETLHSILVEELRNFFPKNDGYSLKQYLYSSGKWLKGFQEATKKPYDKQIIYEDIPDRIYKQLELGNRLGALDGKLISQLNDYIANYESLFDSSFSWYLVGAHSDFIPANIMVRKNGGRTVVLDFAAFKYSLPHRDVVSFLCSLDFLGNKFLIKRGTVEKWKIYFLEGYGGFDVESSISKLCRIRENLGYLLNLYYIPDKSPLKNIGVRWSIKMIQRDLWEIIRKGDFKYAIA